MPTKKLEEFSSNSLFWASGLCAGGMLLQLNIAYLSHSVAPLYKALLLCAISIYAWMRGVRAV